MPDGSPSPASRDAVSQTLHSGGSRRAPDAPGGPPKGALRLEANLGAHSPSNFYRGLSGNSVVDFGGLFVATYSAPRIGTPLWLTVTLPGGYEFTAAAVVRWTREQAAGDGQPGFGAELCAVSVEARKLVERFTRNREPLFHEG
jgi:hypothetical protein